MTHAKTLKDYVIY